MYILNILKIFNVCCVIKLANDDDIQYIGVPCVQQLLSERIGKFTKD